MSDHNKRVNGDVTKLMMQDFKVELTMEDNMHEFVLQFHGPEGSLYHGYMWSMKVVIPAEYPFKPPQVQFVESIYHPNIHELNGTICVDVLNETWTPVADLVAVFEFFIPQLLKYPNPEDPLNTDAAHLLMTDEPTYEARVREYCERYATLEETPEEEMSDGEDEIEEMSVDEDETLAAMDEIENLSLEETKNDIASGQGDDP